MDKNINMILNKFKNKIKKIIFSPENIFNKKYAAGELLELNEWVGLYPDWFIAKYENIDCDDNFKIISQKLHKEKRILLTIREIWNIYNWVIKTADLKGDIAEVGVYKGGSAKLISQIKGDKKLHLFDTFEGMPEKRSEHDNISAGAFSEGLDEVKNYLGDNPDIFYYKGIFPDTAPPQSAIKFSFIHIDVDIYSSTLSALEYFYPRLLTGGAIITHDYRCKGAAGVKQAFDEFFSYKPETIIELWDTQALVIKI
jgi:O-methyltransferase